MVPITDSCPSARADSRQIFCRPRRLLKVEEVEDGCVNIGIKEVEGTVDTWGAGGSAMAIFLTGIGALT